MGQQVGRVGESTSTGLQAPQPHASQPHQGKGNRGSGAGRRPREPGSSSTGTPPGRTAAVNVPDPSINVFTLHSADAVAIESGAEFNRKPWRAFPAAVGLYCVTPQRPSVMDVCVRQMDLEDSDCGHIKAAREFPAGGC
ncbi:hypothetical protein EYF80_000534 [Liparis tanakae]|uniref:Uncharacterized protein n=1 Tax=Liparis tanakae TaxID=230148 RepID=A0A4Z2JG65_9TELE|nr:hypothetical protein EYF80_000534 [Liparis tanakae]